MSRQNTNSNKNDNNTVQWHVSRHYPDHQDAEETRLQDLSHFKGNPKHVSRGPQIQLGHY